MPRREPAPLVYPFKEERYLRRPLTQSDQPNAQRLLRIHQWDIRTLFDALSETNVRKLQDNLITHPDLQSSFDLAELAAKLDYEIQLHHEHLEFIAPLARHVESHCTSHAIKLDAILATYFAGRVTDNSSICCTTEASEKPNRI